MKKEAPEQTTVSGTDQYCPCYTYVDGNTDPDCPMHGSKAGPKPLSVILDEIEERANKATDLGEELLREVTIDLQNRCIQINPNFVYPILRAAFAKLLDAGQNPSLVKALRESRILYLREVGRDSWEHKNFDRKIAAILNQK